MTPDGLTALIQQWRERKKKLSAFSEEERAWEVELCADQLEALIAAIPQDEKVVPPLTAGGNEVVVENGVYKSRPPKPFSELRAQMSPESQARAAVRTAEMLAELNAPPLSSRSPAVDIEAIKAQALAFARDYRREAALWPKNERAQQVARMLESHALDMESLVARLRAAIPQQEWRCFHCDEVFTTVGEARDHFGATQNSEPGCLIDRVALEKGGTPERGRGLLMALRRAEERIAEISAENERLDNEARLWHESEADRVRRIGHVQWWQELDSREGEKLVLLEKIAALEAALPVDGREPPQEEQK